MTYPPPPYEPPPAPGQPHSGVPYSPQPYGNQPYGQPQYGQPYGQPQYGQPPHPQQPYGAPPPGFPTAPPPKKAGPLKAVLITVGVVLAVCVGASVIIAVAVGDDKPKATTAGAAADDPSAAEGGRPDGEKGQFGLKLGTKVTVTGDDTTQHVTIKSIKSFKKACNEFFPDPEKGLFVVVDVQVEAVTGTVPVNSLYFEWIAPDGTTSDSIGGAFSGCEKSSLASTDLRAGQKRAGQIAFDVASAKGTIEFTPNIFSEAVASWTI